VTTTHLTSDSAEERAEQVAALTGLHADAMETGVLVGDLSTTPDADELRPMRERFLDAWEVAADRDDQAGWRFWRRDAGATSPAGSPQHRIDQVWVTPGIAVASARVLDGAGASDHLPLVVDLLVPSGV